MSQYFAVKHGKPCDHHNDETAKQGNLKPLMFWLPVKNNHATKKRRNKENPKQRHNKPL